MEDVMLEGLVGRCEDGEEGDAGSLPFSLSRWAFSVAT